MQLLHKAVYILFILPILTSGFDFFGWNRNRIPLGVDYYPEAWPIERRKVDMQMMREAGVNIVRIAEFSWVKLVQFLQEKV